VAGGQAEVKAISERELIAPSEKNQTTPRRSTMPRNRSATGKPIREDRTYISFEGFHTNSLPEPLTMPTGTIVPGSHPVMRYCAHCFVEVEVPRHEWPSPFREAIAQPLDQQAA
jgi:hypothetical protein